MVQAVQNSELVKKILDHGIVGRVTDCGVRGLGFKSLGSILTSRTETSSLSRVVRDGWDPCSVPLSGGKKSHSVESSTWPLNSHNCSGNYPKNNTNNSKIIIIIVIIIIIIIITIIITIIIIILYTFLFYGSR